MAKYKVKWIAATEKEPRESEVCLTASSALFEARRIALTEDARMIVVLRDSEGEDHPDNAGKFFLYHIVK